MKVACRLRCRFFYSIDSQAKGFAAEAWSLCIYNLSVIRPSTKKSALNISFGLPLFMPAAVRAQICHCEVAVG